MKVIITIEIENDEVKVSTEKEPETKNDWITPVTEGVSQYARFFDDGCTGWCKDAEANKIFLIAQEHYANELLRKKGYLFLNDVYDMLGIPETKAGQIVGWIYNEENPVGDNYVDFGLDELRNVDFINGYARVPLLDFNVDGNILDLI